jgi:hypothetical protein
MDEGARYVAAGLLEIGIQLIPRHLPFSLLSVSPVDCISLIDTIFSLYFIDCISLPLKEKLPWRHKSKNKEYAIPNRLLSCTVNHQFSTKLRGYDRVRACVYRPASECPSDGAAERPCDEPRIGQCAPRTRGWPGNVLARASVPGCAPSR